MMNDPYFCVKTCLRIRKCITCFHGPSGKNIGAAEMKFDASFTSIDMENTRKSLFGEANEPNSCKKEHPYVQIRYSFSSNVK